MAISSSGLLPWLHGRFGNPTHPAYIPNILLGRTDRMGLLDRFQNLILDLFTSALYYPLYEYPAHDLVQRYIGNTPPLRVSIGTYLPIQSYGQKIYVPSVRRVDTKFRRPLHKEFNGVTTATAYGNHSFAPPLTIKARFRNIGRYLLCDVWSAFFFNTS